MLDYKLLSNECINDKPLVLCNTLFTVTDKQTDIQGYWLDNKGKVYIDNIIQEKYFAIDTCQFNARIKTLFSNGEKCIFYKDIYNHGILQYPCGKIEVLKNRIAWLENKKPSQEYIKELLNNNNGLTIYRLAIKKYLIEIYK